MKYKVGDRVLIKSLDWYNENKDPKHGYVDCGNGIGFYKHMTEYCGKVMTISEIWDCCYDMEGHVSAWNDEMIEGLVEEEFEVDLIPKFGEYSDNEPLDIPTMTTEFVKEHGLPCPDGYIFKDENGNVINATKIVLEKKKKEYPKTYEECREIVKVGKEHTLAGEILRNDDYKIELLISFQKLLICRDAYWKIAGEEMGLNRPWEPDYDSGVNKYGIICLNGVVQESNPTTNWERHLNKVLDFPTAEMRDAFKENFNPDIEICKELL